jgi:hypothetical protein
VQELVALDFFVAPTVRHKALFVLVILAHYRRRVVHSNATEHPATEWTAQQVVDASSWDHAPGYLLRDQDHIYSGLFRQRVRDMGTEDVRTTPRSPWQKPYVERLIGSIRRECLGHVIVLHERHLWRLMTEYFHYSHHWRTHRALAMDYPRPRPVQRSELGVVPGVPEGVGCIITMSGEPRADTPAHLPVSRGDEFSGATGVSEAWVSVLVTHWKARLADGVHRRAESRVISCRMSSLDVPEEHSGYPRGHHIP